MSGGQQQRVAVAVLLLHGRNLSWPMNLLQTSIQNQLQHLLEIMEKLNHEEKITFIFSTHDPRVVKMAHRVITLEDGKVVSDDIGKNRFVK